MRQVQRLQVQSLDELQISNFEIQTVSFNLFCSSPTIHFAMYFLDDR